MGRVTTVFTRFILLAIARLVLGAGALLVLVSAWVFHGYQGVGCHPMFASAANIDCTPLQALAAEHAVFILQKLAPFRDGLQAKQSELGLWLMIFIAAALLVELGFACVAIYAKRRSRHRARSDLPDIDEERTRPNSG